MRFFERPFTFLTPLFVVGILLGDLMTLEAWVLIPLIAVCGWSLWRMFRRKMDTTLTYAVVIIGFIYSGISNIQTERNTYSITQNGEVTRSMIGEITEVDPGKKNWRRCIFTISGIIEENSISAHHEKLLCYVSTPNLEVHDKLLLRKKIFPIQNTKNQGEFDTKSYWNKKDVYGVIYLSDGDFKVINKEPTPLLEQWRTRANELFLSIFTEHLEGDELAIASALVLGDKSLLDQEVKQSFGAAGAMHVLAVSGLHVGIILEILLFFFARIPKLFTKKRALILALLILWMYAMVIGFPPSVVRATLMFTLLSIGRLSSQQSDSLNILFFSAFSMLLFEPLLIYDIGFQLSYLAMLGILTVYKPISTLFYIPNKCLRKLWEGTSVGIAAQVFTFPLTLYYFHQFPNYFLLTNIGMMLFAGVVLSLGIILLSLNWIGFVGKLIAVAFSFSLMGMLFFVQWIEHLPGSLAYGFVIDPWMVIACYALLIAILLFRKHRFIPKIAIGISILLLIFIQIDRFTRMEKRELVVFNSSRLIIAMKDGATTNFFFISTPAKIDKVKFLGDAYMKANSTRGKYTMLRRGITTYKSRKNTLILDMSLKGVLVTIKPSNKQFYVRVSTDSPYLNDMPNLSMNYLPVTPDAIGLKDGPYTIPLDD